MARTLLVCAALLLPLVSWAAAPHEPAETVIRLTVQPMPAPRPALRYQLLPELTEITPGNPVQGYLKCFMEQNNFFFSKESVADREKWQTIPLKELPVPLLRTYGGTALRLADEAARFETPDWQITLKLRTESIHLLLPEVQQLRTLATALKVRFRAELAERRFDDALRTAKTMLALSRHLSEHPTLIGGLVGMAIAGLAVGPLEEMLEQPGCPNLYWALTELPSPFLDLRKGTQGERMLVVAETALFDPAEPMSETQLQKAVARVRELMKFVDGPDKPKEEPGAWLEARARDEAHVRAARKRLVEAGLVEERVKKFPPLQVVLLDEKYECEARRDDMMKGLALPHWEFEAVHAAIGARKDGEILFKALLSNWLKIRRAQARLDQRIALLRSVEAVRLYAAGHSGKLPPKLADVEVPLPVDPFTGKPFVYKLDGATAILQGTAPVGEKSAAFHVRYEVTIRK